MKKIDFQMLMFVLVVLVAVGCHHQPAKTKEQVMQERLAERLDRWKADMNKKCRREVEEKAVALTDSIIIANARQNRDTSILSVIPGRPTRPDYRPPTDSVPVKPLLEPRKDTLGQ
ncbi:MAG: hypothetical protein HY842_01375 [Bacteroidetes bacterium]|nr:hypothetical protein [Bacteroidota bacterium]